MIATPMIPVTWDESEAMKLRSALTVIDTWEDNLDVLFDLDSDSSSSDVSQPKKRKSKGCKAPYKRKHQIVALRTQVQELQDVVALAKAVVASAAEAITFQCRWKQIAETQQQRRLTAELANAKLRQLLQAQGNYSRRIMKMAKQTSYIDQALTAVPTLPSFLDFLGPNIDPVTQLRNMDALISQATRVFSYKPFTSPRSKSFQQTQFLTSTPQENGADMECTAVWMLPFDVQQVADALWVQTMCPTDNYKTSMDIYEDTNALVSQFMATSELSAEWGAIQGQVAARMLPRDLGDGSVLIVMKMEAKSFVGSEAKGCASFDGWIRVESVRSQDPAQTGPLSLIKWYRRTLMQSPAAAELTKSERCKWTQAVIASPIRAQFEKKLVMVISNADLYLHSGRVDGDQGWEALADFAKRPSSRITFGINGHRYSKTTMLASPLHEQSLQATLAVIRAWDGDLDSLLQTDSDSSSSNVSQPIKPKTARRPEAPFSPRGTVRTHEIVELRAEVIYLQSAIELGKTLTRRPQAETKNTPDIGATTWAEVAGVQQQRRFAAELENAKLRKLMQSQTKHIKRIRRLVRQVNQVERAFYVPPLPLFMNYIGPSIDPAVHLQLVDALIQRATQVFSSRAFTARETHRFQSHQFLSSTPPEDGADLECQAMWMVPGDMPRVANALWIQTMRPTTDDKTCMDIYENANALVSQLMGTSSIDDLWGVAQGQVAARMLPPDLGDGSVLIVMKMELQSFVGSQTRACASYEGWIRIEPVRPHALTRMGPLCLIKWYRRALLQPPQAAALTKSERCKWTEAVIAGPIRSRFAQVLTSSMHGLDDMLLRPKLQPPVTWTISGIDGR